MKILVVGAGNGHDLPLRRLAQATTRVDLVDLDADALMWARRRLPRDLRRRIRVGVSDVTGGAANELITNHAVSPVEVRVPADAVGDAPYDFVIGDLLYSQLLGPSLPDLGFSATEQLTLLRDQGQRLTDGVVARLHASAPFGSVLHVHDLLGWWTGHEQPLALCTAIERAQTMPHDAERVLAGGRPAEGCDPRRSLTALGCRIVQTSWWHWTFQPGVDYLVCATEARGHQPASRW